jgi:hypothetical protein
VFSGSESRNLINVAKVGRMAAQTPKAKTLRSKTARRQMAAKLGWNPSDLPGWLTENVYREKIQPELAGIKVRTIAEALGVSEPYATEIGRKKRVPHPRHWEILSESVTTPRWIVIV